MATIRAGSDPKTLVTEFALDLVKEKAQKVVNDKAIPYLAKAFEEFGPRAQATWKAVGDVAGQAAYNALTERRESTDYGQERAFLTDPTKGGKGDWKRDLRPEEEFNPERVRDISGGEGKRFAGQFTRKGPEYLQSVLDNPVLMAKLASVAAPTAGVMAGGALLNSIAGGSRPSTDYSVPVQPSGGYNPSVESALASSQAKYALEEQKHQHNIEMQMMREQSRIPGVQNTSVGGYGGTPGTFDNSGTQAMLERAMSNRPKYF